jgi:flavodoxin
MKFKVKTTMRHIKQTITIAIVFALIAIFLAACMPNEPQLPSGADGSSATETESNHTVPDTPKNEEGEKMLVTYFSCTGTTEGIAKNIANTAGGKLNQILPEIPYTTADLNYNDNNSRANKERNDSTARPAIKDGAISVSNYDAIFLGYPIWWGQAPKIISTFLESQDFSDKTIVPFCTSYSSGIGSSDTNLHELVAFANWLPGKCFANGASKTEVSKWIAGLITNDLEKI